MATKSEDARTEELRAKARAKHEAEAAPEPAPVRNPGHVAGKATYAYEPPHPGTPSRRSTRKSANRAKPDAALTKAEGMRKGTPEAVFRRTRDRAARVRGTAH